MNRRTMIKAFRVIAFVIAASIAVLLAALPWQRVPLRSIEFEMHILAPTNGVHQLCEVLVSNTLSSLVICYFKDGFTEPVVITSYLSNHIWYEIPGPRFGGGSGVIQPHQALKAIVEIPPGAAAVRVGLPVTPLSWKGRLGYNLLFKRRPDVFHPLGGFLLSRDTGKASNSRIEWSNPQPVQPVE
jgi:hypothetical protein